MDKFSTPKIHPSNQQFTFTNNNHIQIVIVNLSTPTVYLLDELERISFEFQSFS